LLCSWSLNVSYHDYFIYPGWYILKIFTIINKWIFPYKILFYKVYILIHYPLFPTLFILHVLEVFIAVESYMQVLKRWKRVWQIIETMMLFWKLRTSQPRTITRSGDVLSDCLNEWKTQILLTLLPLLNCIVRFFEMRSLSAARNLSACFMTKMEAWLDLIQPESTPRCWRCRRVNSSSLWDVSAGFLGCSVSSTFIVLPHKVKLRKSLLSPESPERRKSKLDRSNSGYSYEIEVDDNLIKRTKI